MGLPGLFLVWTDTFMIKTGAQILWECLEQQGVTTVFGYPGGAILPAYDALKYSNIHHVLVRHEQGAAHMADGYARASGRVGVASRRRGRGHQLVTGIATAMLDSSSIVCITGQVGSKLIGTDAFQETDITGVTLPVTKHNYLVTRASDIAPTIAKRSMSRGRAVPARCLVDITKDAQQSTCEFDGKPVAPQLPGYRPDLSPTSEEYKQALELIHNSKRPVILAGHGIILSGAMEEVRAFAEKANIPVGLTLLGLGGFPASHPLSLGMMGMHGFGDRLLEAPRSFADRTSISGAIAFAMDQFARTPYAATRRTIDISGDGTNNSGADVMAARDTALAQGVTHQWSRHPERYPAAVESRSHQSAGRPRQLLPQPRRRRPRRLRPGGRELQFVRRGDHQEDDRRGVAHDQAPKRAAAR